MKKSIKNSSQNKTMLLLADLRLLARKRKINVKTALNPKTLKDNLYVTYAREMIKAGFLNQAELLFFDVRYKKEKIRLEKGIAAYALNDINDCFKYLKSKYNYLFYRGNYNEWNEILNKIKADKYLFYAADSKYWPRFFKPKFLDIIYINENYQKLKIKKLYPKSKIVLLDKTANPKTFYPDPKIKKIYDICYPANFMPWKDHNTLFNAIRKIKSNKPVKLVCVGKTFDRRTTIEVWGRKSNFDLTLIESLPSYKLARIMRQSKIGVVPNELDANPRTLTEMLACGLPIVANENLTDGLKLINMQTGIKTSVDSMPKALENMLKNYKKYKPAEYFQKHLMPETVTQKCFIDVL